MESPLIAKPVTHPKTGGPAIGLLLTANDALDLRAILADAAKNGGELAAQMLPGLDGACRQSGLIIPDDTHKE